MAIFGYMILFLYTVTHPKNRILAVWNAVFLWFRDFSKKDQVLSENKIRQ